MLKPKFRSSYKMGQVLDYYIMHACAKMTCILLIGVDKNTISAHFIPREGSFIGIYIVVQQSTRLVGGGT